MFVKKFGFALKLIGFFAFLAFILLMVQRFTNSKVPYTVNLSSQTVIKQIQSLNRLETSVYTIEKVIDVGTTGGKFSQLLYGDRILLIAHGSVIAGFDLSEIENDDVKVSGTSLNISLPAPEILVSKLDNDQTRVYDRQQGLLTKGDQNLESEARLEAEHVIRDAACKGGILENAEKNARAQMTSFFEGAGFNEVIINIPQGSC